MSVGICWLLLLGTVAAKSGKQCEILEKTLADEGLHLVPRAVHAQGKPTPIVVKWDGLPAGRAAAALFAVLLGHALRYTNVQLMQEPPNSLERALLSNESMYDSYSYFGLWPAAAVPIAMKPRKFSCNPEVLCSTRTSVLGPGAAPAAVTLFVHLAESDGECQRANSWPFFTNGTALSRCGFLGSERHTATVYYLSEYQHIADELERRAKHYGLLWSLKELNDNKSRRKFHQMLRDGAQSFLFLEQEVWSTAPRVFSSQHPRCLNTSCHPSLDPVYTVRLANAFGLDFYVPDILSLFLNFAPTQNDIREILEEETNLDDQLEEAVCTWSVKHIDRFNSWFKEEITSKYWILVIMCPNEPDKPEYVKAIKNVTDLIVPDTLKIEIQRQVLENCSDDTSLKNRISIVQKYRQFRKLIGFVGSGEGGRNAAAQAQSIESALVLYDSVSDNYSENSVTRGFGGSASQLAAAVAKLVTGCGWARLAVLSDVSSLAKRIYAALSNSDLVHRNAQLQTPSKVKEHLEGFRNANARIFYVNTDAETAIEVLCEAMALGMTHEEGYVWLVREWRAQNYTCRGVAEKTRTAMRHYTVSPWWRGHDLAKKQNLSAADVNWSVRKRLQGLWEPGLWPPRAAPLIDGLLLLTHSADAFFTTYRNRSTDLHGNGSVKLFWSSLDSSIPGVTGELHPNKLDDPVMYIDEWSGGRLGPRSLDVWRMRGDDEAVGEICGGKISDGGKRCVTMRWYGPGDQFVWRCHDWTILLTALVVMLAVPALVLARRARLARLKRSERMLKAQLAARGVRAAHELGSQLVDRALLELRHEIGAGRFGRVRLAVLRPPERSAIAVAAKALPDDATPAEERDFLREACLMASLEHSHIVRLIGVCATDGPPLVLMEYAFFGDLCEYLRSRRHLAENIGENNEEAEHVSAASLTRLGSEAASALAYLASKRFVHRDVRAANCLVDARRSLKLADFGMARQTAPSSEYWCQRRGYFPVLWMAPESLEQGVFSPASDVWALGVLYFELVTLGERPYGKWLPMRVMKLVEGGGRPPLPPDTTYTTRHVLLSCWRRSPRTRVTARALHEYLRARRTTLAPALLPPPEPNAMQERAPSILSIDAFAQPEDL